MKRKKSIVNKLMKGIASFTLISLIILMTAVTTPKKVLATSKSGMIIEHLRVHVPITQRKSWVKAEEKSWEPWLESKDGFLGRQLLWDRKNEEATILISWESREKWKSISTSEIEEIQELFEKIAREETGILQGNPFPLKFEGELLQQ